MTFGSAPRLSMGVGRRSALHTVVGAGAAWLALPVASSASVVHRPLHVFVSVLPERYLVERIAGARAQVSVMVGPGESPVTYAPRPRQMAALMDAVLYCSIGAPFEDAWMPRIIAANPRMAVINLSKGLIRRPMDMSTGPTASGAMDPHVWTSPRLMRQMAPRIRNVLIRIDPANRSEYERNHAALDADLVALDRDVRAQLAQIERREFLVFHPSWGYLADDYGLRQIPIEIGGKEPGPRTLSRIIANARALHMRTIFVQPQFSRRTAQFIADQIGAGLVVADPLAEDYLANTRKVAAALAQAEKRA